MKQNGGEMKVSLSYSYALTAKGVAFYAEKKLRELQDMIQQLERDME